MQYWSRGGWCRRCLRMGGLGLEQVCAYADDNHRYTNNPGTCGEVMMFHTIFPTPKMAFVDIPYII